MSRANDHRRTARPPRSGLTLIEMLMATAITLLMMAAIVNLFATMTASISGRRAVIELNGQLRQVRQRLALDLAGCTVPPGDDGLMPWRQRPGEAIGYFEIVEGSRSDYNPSSLTDGIVNAGNGNFEIDYTTSIIPSSQKLDPDDAPITDGRGLGDFDDILALTVRSLDQPFVADVGGNRIESNLAEVLWYALETPADDPSTPADESGGKEPGLRTIYRKVLLSHPGCLLDHNTRTCRYIAKFGRTAHGGHGSLIRSPISRVARIAMRTNSNCQARC